MSKKYKRNFLKKVVLRIDLAEIINLASLKNFAEEIKKDFPIFQKLNVWVFFNKNKTKSVELSPDNLVLYYKKYKNSEELLRDVKNVVKKFISIFGIKTIRRLGLRYVNAIHLEEKKYLDWKKYINSDLLGGIKFSIDNKEILTRYIGNLRLKEKEDVLSFGFGILNEDSPNEINKKEFILDFDCYSLFPFNAEKTDLVKKVTTYKQHIGRLFEKSITNSFRRLLNK